MSGVTIDTMHFYNLINVELPDLDINPHELYFISQNIFDAVSRVMMVGGPMGLEPQTLSHSIMGQVQEISDNEKLPVNLKVVSDIILPTVFRAMGILS